MRNTWSCVMVATLLAMAASGADWPRWRGPDNTGHAPAGQTLPKALPPQLKVVWKLAVGEGLGSPVVSGGRVFYLDHQKGREMVHAVEADTGRHIWSAELDEVFRDAQSVPGPRFTPLVDENRVYVQSCRGELRCLDAADGHVLWRTNYVKDFGAVFIGERGSATGASRHGYTGSPVIEGRHMFAAVGGTSGASVVCFDKTDGKVVWKSQNDVPGYGGLVLSTIAGARHVIAFTAEAVIGLSAADGALLWRVPVKTALGRHVTTPVVVEDTVIVASHQAGMVAVKVSRTDGDIKAAVAWTSKESAINFASPVAVGQYLYGVGPARNLFCLDVRTGRQTWSVDSFLKSGGGRHFASLLVIDAHILVLTDSGELVIIAADPKEYREAARFQVCGTNWCSPAWTDGRLYLRDARELKCLSF